MKPLETVPVALTRPMLEAIQAAVDSGEYANAGEVVRDAVRSWQAARAIRNAAAPLAHAVGQDRAKDADQSS